MEFFNDAQKSCYEKIKPWLKELFGEMIAEHPEIPSFQVKAGSAVVTITVLPWREEDVVVRALSFVVRGADLTPECCRYLLDQNANFVFGGFFIDSDGDIGFRSTILGSTIDKPELRTLILAVAATADNEDDKIRERWGGQRAEDVIASMH